MNNEPGSQAEPGQAQGAEAKTEPKTEARALVQCSEIKKPTNSSRKVVNKVSTMRTTTNPATATTIATTELTTTTTTKPSKSSRQATP